MSQPKYRGRRLTPKQRAELLAGRKERGHPRHSPPHRPNFGHLRFHITAACFDHQPCIGHRPGRLDIREVLDWPEDRVKASAPREARVSFPHHPLGILLGRLAVARSPQGQGLGRILVGAALEKFMTIFQVAGGIGLFVDAKDEHAQRFYEGLGFVPLPSNPRQLFLPVKTIQMAVGSWVG